MKLSRGKRFRDARTVYNQHGFQTMDEVMAETDVQKSIISALESDKSDRSVGYDKVAALAAYYGVSTDYLLGLTDDHNKKPCTSYELGISQENVYYLSNNKTLSALLINSLITAYRNAEGAKSDFILFLRAMSVLESPETEHISIQSKIASFDAESERLKQMGLLVMLPDIAAQFHLSRCIDEIKHELFKLYGLSDSDIEERIDDGND